jgi:hypothetical protein
MRTDSKENLLLYRESLYWLRPAAVRERDLHLRLACRVERAGRVVAGVNGQHGIGLIAESVVCLLYDFFYHFITTLLSAVYSGGGGGSRSFPQPLECVSC